MLKKKSLVDDVINEIVRGIEAGDYTYGDKLPSQEKLAEQFNVSRIVVREALVKLSSHGIISFKQGKGTYLNKMNSTSMLPLDLKGFFLTEDDQFQSIWEARRIIEKETARLAAFRKTEKNLTEIGDSIINMQNSVKDVDSFAKWDIEFHIRIAQASKNPILERVLVMIKDSYWDQVVKSFELPGIIQKSIDDHIEIFEAIKAGDTDKAAQSMDEHLNYAEQKFK